jgi:hypothetical protein
MKRRNVLTTLGKVKDNSYTWVKKLDITKHDLKFRQELLVDRSWSWEVSTRLKDEEKWTYVDGVSNLSRSGYEIEIKILYARSGEGSSVRKIVLSNMQREKLLVAEEVKNLSEKFYVIRTNALISNIPKLYRIRLMLAMHRW